MLKTYRLKLYFVIYFRNLPYDSLPVRKHAYDCTRMQKLLNNYIEFFDIDLSKCEMIIIIILVQY